MKKLWMMLLAAGAVIGAFAGENLVQNGDFKLVKGRRAEGWANVGNLEIGFLTKGGATPESGWAKLTAPAANAEPLTGSIRQKLAGRVEAGRQYRISAAFKGDGFKADDYGILVINKGWKGNVGVRRFQMKDGEWIVRTKVVSIPADWTEPQLVIFVYKPQGSMSVSDVKIELVP